MCCWRIGQRKCASRYILPKLWGDQLHIQDDRMARSRVMLNITDVIFSFSNCCFCNNISEFDSCTLYKSTIWHCITFSEMSQLKHSLWLRSPSYINKSALYKWKFNEEGTVSKNLEINEIIHQYRIMEIPTKNLDVSILTHRCVSTVASGTHELVISLKDCCCSSWKGNSRIFS